MEKIGDNNNRGVFERELQAGGVYVYIYVHVVVDRVASQGCGGCKLKGGSIDYVEIDTAGSR